MLNPQFILPFADEIVVDLFAGGGGASTGIEQALGRHVDIAINHDPVAISLHQANHPQTKHFVSDVFEVDPLAVTNGQKVGLLWASPDCTYHSKARGGKPFRDRAQANRRRSLAWIVVKWVKVLKPTGQHPRVIHLENVEEWQNWGPLDADGKPCKARAGKTFQRWVKMLQNLGYAVEWRELRASNYGAPTIRKRLFLIARCDGQPIVWPEFTHGAPESLPVQKKKLATWRTAAECIDWDVPAPSIFERKKPLADATCRRIAKGIMRYVVNTDEPFIVKYHAPKRPGDDRTGSLNDPLPTQTTENRFGLVIPTLVQTGYGERPPRFRCKQCLTVFDVEPLCGCTACGNEDDLQVIESQAPRALDIEKPLGTVVGSQKHALVSAFLAKHYTGVTGSHLDDPIATVTSVDHHSLVTAHMVHLGHGEGTNGTARFSHGIRSVEDPLNTVTASGAVGGLVTAHMITIDNASSPGGHKSITDPLLTTVTENRHALVTSHIMKMRGDNVGSPCDEPLHTVSEQGTHHAEVRAFLLKYYGTDQDPSLTEPLHTVTTRDRFGLVVIHGTQYAIVDIGLRMLTPRELFRAQGFPADYQIAAGADGHPLTKTAQVRLCGNSVCPPVAKAIVAANYHVHEYLRAVA